MIKFDEEEFSEFVQYINDNYGIDLSKKKILVECRLNGNMRKRNIVSLREFLKMMKEDRTGRLEDEVLDRLTTNYTYFVRESKHFEYLEQKILPLMQPDREEPLSIWCAGCSSGEECYTLSMLIHSYMRKGGCLPKFSILGSDISENSLKKAREARYSISELKKIPDEWQRVYLNIDYKNECFEIRPMIRREVKFSKMNLMKPTAGQSQYDIIFCRNVMIYFDEGSRKKLLKRLYGSLKPGGYLFLGHAELLYRDNDLFQYVWPAVYRKQENK